MSGSLRGKRSRVDDSIEYLLIMGGRKYFSSRIGDDGN